MAVPLGYFVMAVNFFRERALCNLGRPRTQAHACAFILHAALFLQQRDDWLLRFLVELRAVGVFDSADVARELDRRHLHAETKPQIWNLMLTREPGRFDFSLHAALAETAGNQNAGHIF